MTEDEIRATLPTYVGSFNQPSYLRQMVGGLLRNGFGNVRIFDNASTSPKLLDLLDELEARPGVSVYRHPKNIGPHLTVEFIKTEEAGPFVFTDPDLALAPDLPRDMLSTLFRISERYRCKKVGLALEIPAAEVARDLVFVLPPLGTFTVQEWERKFWMHKIEPQVYRANVDTTFHLWNPRIHLDVRRAYKHMRDNIRPRRLTRILPRITHTDIRVAKPGFVARHLPWYTDDQFPDDERDFYKQTASRASTWLRDSD